MEYNLTQSSFDIDGDNEERVEVSDMYEEPECDIEDNQVQPSSFMDELESKLTGGTIMSSIEDAYLIMSSIEFVLSYEKIQNRWRESEKNENTRCQGMAGQILKRNPLLSNVADLYTLNVYKMFELEFLESLNIVFVEQSDLGDGVVDFKVRSHSEHSKIRKVVFNKHNHQVKCTCHHFQTVGILCRHALRVFNYMNVTVLPESCIKQRWLKNVRPRINNEVEEIGNGGYRRFGYECDLLFVNQTMRTSYDLVHLCKSHQESRFKLTEMLDGAREQLSDLVKSLSVDDCCIEGSINKDNDRTIEMHLRNPLTAKEKGLTNARITRHWDDHGKKKVGKGKSKVDTSSARGSKRKPQSSREGTNSQSSNYVPSQQHPSYPPPQHPTCPPQQHPTISPLQYPFAPHFQSQFDANQSYWQFSNQEGNSGNIYSNGQTNIFGYLFGTPNSSQGRSDNN